MRATSVLRHSSWDWALVALLLVHAAALVLVPSVVLIAIALWWNANTISHNFIHLPFFRSRQVNTLFAIALTIVLGFPQSLWRARHLAHHAGREDAPVKWTSRILVEVALVAGLWMLIGIANPNFFFLVYLPGYAIGLALCQVQGYFEHAHDTTSHYGRVYNALFFRDGLHVEHHARPSTHWTRLRAWRFGEARETRSSAWPPVLRWMDEMPALLDALERLVLRSHTLQAIVLRSHESAFRACLSHFPDARHVVIIGGGLFPRSALIIRRLMPAASITIVDRSARSLESARRILGSSVETIEADCSAKKVFDADLVIVPLAFVGDREAFYRDPPAAMVIVHDWIWRRRGDGRVVSWWLLKRVNVIRRNVAASRRAA